ncbi:hypothetical protein CRYUN_Cryun14cG0133100 [Craigia yunnanensis]
MHEYELKAAPTTTVSYQKTYNLCKLKKKADISSTEAGQSSSHSLSNSENHKANNAMSEDLLNPNWSSEPEASNDSDVVHNQSSCIETYAGERSNQHNVVNEDEYSNLSSNFINHVAEDAIPKEPSHLKEVSTERNGPNDNNRVQNSYSAIEQDDKSCNSIVTNNDKMVPIERSNQHNTVVAVEGFKMPSNLEYLADEDLIPMDLLYNDGLSLDELLGEPEATNNSDWIQNQNTNIEDGEFLNSFFIDNIEAYFQEENIQQYLAADNEGFNFPCVMESSNTMEKSRKRPRLEYDGFSHSHHVETGEAQPWGKEYPYSS